MSEAHQASTQPSYRNRLGYHAGLLGGICCFVSIMLISGNKSTNELIQEHATNDKLQMLAQVMPADMYDNDPLTDSQKLDGAPLFTNEVEILPARKEGLAAGAALQLRVPGWGGDIDFIMAVNAAGEITGVRIISHKETPGLADKIEIEKDSWITSFDGKSLSNVSEENWKVKKDGGQFDQFTGATITPRAVVGGVYKGLQFYKDWAAGQTEASSEE